MDTRPEVVLGAVGGHSRVPDPVYGPAQECCRQVLCQPIGDNVYPQRHRNE